MTEQTHSFHAGTRGITLSGGVLAVKEEWKHSVLRPGVWVSRAATTEIELIDLWHLETREQGLLADMHTGAVRPLIVSGQITYPKDANEAPLTQDVIHDMRATHLGNEEARMHFPIHGIIGAAKIDWRKKQPRTDDLLRRREWEQSLLKPENLAKFVEVFKPLLRSGLGWERLDFGPILDRIRRRQDAARKAGQREVGERYALIMQRATADLLTVRAMYVAIMAGERAKADLLWEHFSQTIPSAWSEREYAPDADFKDLQQAALEIARLKA